MVVHKGTLNTAAENMSGACTLLTSLGFDPSRHLPKEEAEVEKAKKTIGISNTNREAGLEVSKEALYLKLHGKKCLI